MNEPGCARRRSTNTIGTRRWNRTEADPDRIRLSSKGCPSQSSFVGRLDDAGLRQAVECHRVDDDRGRRGLVDQPPSRPSSLFAAGRPEHLLPGSIRDSGLDHRHALVQSVERDIHAEQTNVVRIRLDGDGACEAVARERRDRRRPDVRADVDDRRGPGQPAGVAQDRARPLEADELRPLCVFDEELLSAPTQGRDEENGLTVLRGQVRRHRFRTIPELRSAGLFSSGAHDRKPPERPSQCPRSLHVSSPSTI